jgi:hypothetical protein
VEHFGLEDHLGRFVGVVLGEDEFEDEDATLPDGIGGPVDHGVPFVDVVGVGYCFYLLLVLFAHTLDLFN